MYAYRLRVQPPPPLVTISCGAGGPSLRSGFRLRAPAPLTPANRLKFESNRRHQYFLRGCGAGDPSLRSGFRHAAQTPRKRLKFESNRGHQIFPKRVLTADLYLTRWSAVPCAHVIASAVRLPHDCALLVWRGRELLLRPESPAQLLGSFARARPLRC